MRMGTTGRLVGERFGHEGGMIAKLVGNHLYAVLESETQVTGSQRFMRAVVDLVLARAVFTVRGDDINANLWHQFDNALGDRGSHVARGIEDMQPIKDRFHSDRLEQVKLIFQPNNGLIPQLIQFGYDFAQHMAWSCMERRAICPIGVTDETGSVVQPGYNRRR